jgi:hypothetical protein
MITNFLSSLLFLFLSFASVALAEGLNHELNNLSEADSILGQFSKEGVCVHVITINGLIDPLGFWLSGFDAGDYVYNLHTPKTYNDSEAAQTLITTIPANKADASFVELKKYISANKFGLGRSFGLNFWVWNNLGLGFVLDRGEAALQVLNHSSDNFLLGPKYRF